jgi:hypothetical protein
MWWECSECGCRVRGYLKPEPCPECGIAGAIFAQSDLNYIWEPGEGALRDYWLELGMNIEPSSEPAQVMSRTG